MRKFLLLSLGLSVMATYARQISPQEAADAANQFIHNSKPLTRGESKLTPVEENNLPLPYYAFNVADGNGFVIISGDDRFSKVLGYSDRGSFDKSKMPPQLKILLDKFAENTARPSNFTSTHPSWNVTFTTRAEEGVLLETAEWGQDAPFNAETPMFGDQHAPTGCVATAMAIVMKYHNWPETYNWDAMPMKIESDGENPPAANPELARLMKDAGEAVYMAYGADESGANMNWVGHRLQQVFKYSPDCQFITSANFSGDRWLELLKGNINNGNPVIYQGTNDNYTQNHAFVLDGYNTTGYHINWGWNGWYNGYYALDALAPNEVQDFSSNNGMVINIVPDKTGKKYSECFTDYGYLFGGAGQGEAMNLSVENVKKGEPFHIVNTLITLKAGFKGLVGMALVDKNDNIKEVLKSAYYTTWYDVDKVWEDQGLTLNFPNLVTSVDVDPTDKLQYVTKHEDEKDYKLVLGTLEWPSYVNVSNNTPRYHKLSFHIGPKATCTYQNYYWGAGSGTLTEGDYEFSIFGGSDVYCIFRPEIQEGDNIVTVSMGGVAFYGDEEKQTGSELHFHPNIYADTYFNASFVEFKEETLILTEPGTLKDKLKAEDAKFIKNLTLSGEMNALDFWFIRDNCPSIHSLDIKNVDIQEITAKDESFGVVPRKQPAAFIPEMALWSLQQLETLILPDNLVGIADNALCALNLKSISIPAGVESIGLNAFFSNQNLQVVELQNPEPIWIKDCVFSSTLCPERGYLYVPKGSIEKYKDAEIWKDFKVIREGKMPEVLSFDTVENGIKYNCNIDEAIVTGYEGEPTNVTIPDVLTVNGMQYAVTIIDNNSFANCNSLETVILGKNVELINDEAFIFCTNLKSVKLSEATKIIRDGAFSYCRNLEECDLPSGLEYIGSRTFWSTALKKVVIPKNTAPIPNYYQGSFANLINLEIFEVDKDNKSFKVIDGVLYRNQEIGLTLECVPGMKKGKVVLPEDCHTVWNYSICNAQNVDEIIFNENLKVIERGAVTGMDGLKTIRLPKNAFVDEESIQSYSLETIIFTGDLSQHQKIIHSSPNIKNIVIDSQDEVIDLNGIFVTPVDEINIFTSSKEKNFDYSGKYKLFVAGATLDEFAKDEATEVQEMWSYGIDREEKVITITPKVDGLAIERVLVNGKEAENIYYSRADSAPAFVCAVDDLDNLNVIVEYKLFGSHKMSSEYNSEFNSELPHTDSGVNSVWMDSSAATDVYTVDGRQVLRNATKEQINRLANGVYILRDGRRSRKVVVHN